jgi:hypothetical protein
MGSIEVFGTDNIGQNGDITCVCEGTDKNDLEYYLARTRRTGDACGQAPVLWCALPCCAEQPGSSIPSSHGHGRI